MASALRDLRLSESYDWLLRFPARYHGIRQDLADSVRERAKLLRQDATAFVAVGDDRHRSLAVSTLARADLLDEFADRVEL